MERKKLFVVVTTNIKATKTILSSYAYVLYEDRFQDFFREKCIDNDILITTFSAAPVTQDLTETRKQGAGQEGRV